MAKSWYHTLESRGFIRIDGPDRVEFLQGLVSNDVTRVTAARAGYGAFLTAQGKFLFDFFLTADGDALVLATDGARPGGRRGGKECVSKGGARWSGYHYKKKKKCT